MFQKRNNITKTNTTLHNKEGDKKEKKIRTSALSLKKSFFKLRHKLKLSLSREQKQFS